MAENLTIRGVVGKWYQTMRDTATVYAGIDTAVSRTWDKTSADLRSSYERLTHQHIVPVLDEEFRAVTGEASHAIQESNEASLRLNISDSELGSLFLREELWLTPAASALMSKLSDVRTIAQRDRALLTSLRWQASLREVQANTPAGYLDTLGISRSVKPSVATGLVILAERGVPAEYVLESGLLKTLTNRRAHELAGIFDRGISASLAAELVA